MEEQNAPIGVLIAFYDNVSDGDRVVRDLKGLSKALAATVLEAAVVVKDPKSDKLKIKGAARREAKKGAMRGAIAGGAIGAIFPPSVLAMGAVGAAAGAAFGHFAEHGFDKNLLQEIGEHLQPNGAAVVAVVDEVWVDRVSEAVRGYSDLTTFSLTAEAAAKLTDKIKD